MKKILLILTVALLPLFSFAQMRILETVTYNGMTYDSCYVRCYPALGENIMRVGIYQYIYKSQWQNEPRLGKWAINKFDEIPTYSQYSYISGDILSLSLDSLKVELLQINPSWQSENIILE